jgi:hypothetical protein
MQGSFFGHSGDQRLPWEEPFLCMFPIPTSFFFAISLAVTPLRTPRRKVRINFTCDLSSCLLHMIFYKFLKHWNMQSFWRAVGTLLTKIVEVQGYKMFHESSVNLLSPPFETREWKYRAIKCGKQQPIYPCMEYPSTRNMWKSTAFFSLFLLPRWTI